MAQETKHVAFGWPFAVALVNVGTRPMHLKLIQSPKHLKGSVPEYLSLDTFEASTKAITGQVAMIVPYQGKSENDFMEELYGKNEREAFDSLRFVYLAEQSSLQETITITVNLHLIKRFVTKLRAARAKQSSFVLPYYFFADQCVSFVFRAHTGIKAFAPEARDRRTDSDAWLQMIESGRLRYLDPKTALLYTLHPYAEGQDAAAASMDTPVKSVFLQTCRVASLFAQAGAVAPGGTSATFWDQNRAWLDMRFYLAGLNSLATRAESAVHRLNAARQEALVPLSTCRLLITCADFVVRAAEARARYDDSLAARRHGATPESIAEARARNEEWVRGLRRLKASVQRFADVYSKATTFLGTSPGNGFETRLREMAASVTAILEETRRYRDSPANVKVADAFVADARIPPILKEAVRFYHAHVLDRILSSGAKVDNETTVALANDMALGPRGPSALASLSKANYAAKAVFKNLKADAGVPDWVKKEIDYTALVGLRALGGEELSKADASRSLAELYGGYRQQYEQKVIEGLSLDATKAARFKALLARLPHELPILDLDALQSRNPNRTPVALLKTPAQVEMDALLAEELGGLYRVAHFANVVQGIGSFLQIAYSVERAAATSDNEVTRFLVNGAKALSDGTKAAGYVLQLAGDVPLAVRLDRLATVTAATAEAGKSLLKRANPFGAVVTMVDGGVNLLEGVAKENWLLALSGGLDIASSVALFIWSSAAGQALSAALQAGAVFVKPDVANARNCLKDGVTYLKNYAVTSAGGSLPVVMGLTSELDALEKEAQDAHYPGAFYTLNTTGRAGTAREALRAELEAAGLGALATQVEELDAT